MSESIATAIDNITKLILESQVDTPTGIGWLSFDSAAHDHPGGRPILRAEPGIYSGRLGVLLYLSAIDAVDGPWTSSIEVIDELLDNTGLKGDTEQYTRRLGIGMADGVGSVIYGLSVLAELTGDTSHLQPARAIANAFGHERIESTTSPDVLLGLAGAVHGLCKLYETDGSEIGLNRAVACGERLLNMRKPKWGTMVWDTHFGSVSSCSTGMGHGAAGIAHALYRLYGHTERTAFRDAADDVLQFERVFYAPDRHNWRANWSNIRDFCNWWCYGTPGIGLARIGSVAGHSADHLRADISRAAEYTPQLGERDALCHGTFAQVALLTELDRKRDSRFHGTAEELAEQAIERSRSEGGYRVVCGNTQSVVNPSLFLGVAGVGYTLLRLFAPEKIPSVTRFE